MIDNLSSLDSAINEYTDWAKPFEFRDFILNNSKLNNNEKEYFLSLWDIASESENWSDSNLIIGCKITQTRLRNVCNLSDESIAIIVRAVSYQWR